MLPEHTRAIVLASRPVGVPTAANFRLEQRPLLALAEGQALVRNTLMSVDPAMRGRMNDGASYVPPFGLGEPLEGQALGEVIASRNASLPVGAIVQHRFGWRDYATVEAATILDTTLGPASAFLGILGGKGLTAYAGLVDVAQVKAGETVYVSAAGGAVGSAAGAIARLLGATTIGSTGSADNVPFLLDELRYDRAFHAREGSIGADLARVAPDGIDVYFDNVGGETLGAALDALKLYGRIAVCGTIGSYNVPVPGPSNLFQIVAKRLRVQGFLVSDHAASADAFRALIVPALRDGRIAAPETYVDGLEKAPEAMISLFRRGAHRGKLLVRLP